MSQFNKLKVAQLEVDQIYVAYSGRNKMLSSNGDKGRLVKLVSKTGDNAKFVLLGTDTEAAITNLSGREDAWVYSPMGAELKVAVHLTDPEEGPKFSPRMVKEGWDGKEFLFDSTEIYTCNRPDDAYYDIALLRHKGDTIKPDNGQPYVNNFRLSWVSPTQAPEWRIPRAERMGLGAIELPLPKKPVPPESKAVIDSLMEHLKSIKPSHTSSNVSFIKVSADLKNSRRHINQGCHANMQSNESFDVRWVVTLGWNKTYPDHADKHQILEYINYIANYSPYADAILTKDPEFIYEHGYVIDATFGNRIVVGACYCTRQTWEKPYRVRAYYHLLQAGVNPDAAFLFGGQCSQFNQQGVKFTLSVGNHNHFQNGNADDDSYIAFMNKKPAFIGAPYIEDCHASTGNGGVDGMWSKKYGSNKSPIYDKLANIKKAGGSPMSNALNADEAIERAADIIDDWCGAHGFM